MQNALSPELMTPTERLEDVASILAAGLLRLRARETMAVSGEREQVLVDLGPEGSGHAATKNVWRDPA